MGVVTVPELKPSISGKRSFRPSSSARHIIDWPISDVLSDLTIEVGSASFALHKFPLVLRSGRIRKLLLEAKDTKVSRINLIGLPGGSDASELAAKFCSGVNVEITISNVALLRCVARSDLERRIDLQLDQAILEDILIPANPHGNNHSPLYDIDSILRIFSLFLKLKTIDIFRRALLSMHASKLPNCYLLMERNHQFRAFPVVENKAHSYTSLSIR
ncbi:hypothetical protein BC332_23913 [Capsicum chinense]|nr:hypothetical protein BC332_23913 [Capsicum chinense]